MSEWKPYAKRVAREILSEESWMVYFLFEFSPTFIAMDSVEEYKNTLLIRFIAFIILFNKGIINYYCILYKKHIIYTIYLYLY